MSSVSIFPAPAEFCEAHKAGKKQVVWSKRICDLDTPVSALLKLLEGDEVSFLLESVEGGETRGRYSILGLDPDMMWRVGNGRSEISHTPPFDNDSFEPSRMRAATARTASGVTCSTRSISSSAGNRRSKARS